MGKNSLALITLAIALLGAWGLNSNLDSIMSFKANHYFKNNDIVSAQKCFEKAFDLGLHKSDDREIYANSLINSPMDMKSLEKMVKFLTYPVDDVSKKKIEYFLYDLKREIHNKYPENYITQAVYNQKIMRWSKNPITYVFENAESAPEYFVKEIETAFDTWERATDREILFTEDNTNPKIKIRFNTHNPADNEEKKYVVAYTLPTVIGDELKLMTIDFYTKDPQDKFFSKNQVYNTALHEIAHALGFMGHSNDKKNVMYLTKDSMDVYHDLRDELSIADINTIRLLYKIKPEITDDMNVKSQYIPYIVLGDDLEISIAKTREAKIYINKAPELPSGYIDLAESYAMQEDYVKAIKNLEKALQLADTDEVKNIVYFNLAVCYLNLDNGIMAEDYIKEALKIKESEESRFVLAEAYSKKGDLEKAEVEYQKLIDKNPKNINYTIALTNIYVTEKNFFKARKVLKKYAKLNPNDKNNPKLKPYGFLNLFL